MSFKVINHEFKVLNSETDQVEIVVGQLTTFVPTNNVPKYVCTFKYKGDVLSKEFDQRALVDKPFTIP